MAKKTTKSADEIAAETSKKEMELKREEITAYYKESIPHLTVQLEYETVLKDIESARAERIQAQTFIANAMAQQQGEAPAATQAPQPSEASSDWDAASDKAPPVRQLRSVE